MSSIVIYGASDDLIEIESDSFPHDEFNVYLNSSSESLFLTVSDGTVLRVRYDEDGIWRFAPYRLGTSQFHIEYGIDDKRHSDVVTLRGDNLTWVALATHIAK